MQEDGTLYRGERRLPTDIELTELEYEDLKKKTKEERIAMYPYLFSKTKKREVENGRP